MTRAIRIPRVRAWFRRRRQLRNRKRYPQALAWQILARQSVIRLNAKPAGPTARARRAKYAKKYLALRNVCAAVDVRDGHQCRHCRLWIGTETSLITNAGHHHHLRPRSLRGTDETSNLVLLCAWCHSEVHAKRLLIQGEDANGVLCFLRVA